MGQNCIGIERFIIHESQYEEFMTEITERVRKLRLGSILAPSSEGFVSVVDGGAMINDDRFETLERLIRDAEDQGAELICGGARWRHPYVENGSYFQPTLLGNVQHTMEIAQQEGIYLVYVDILAKPNPFTALSSICSNHAGDEIQQR